MRWFLTISLALAACKSDVPTEADCERVRMAAAGVPRQYQGQMLFDRVSPATLSNRDVATAVRDGDLVKLESLCGPLTGTPEQWRQEECRLVARWVPSEATEVSGHVGEWDPSVPNSSFRDSEIRAAVKELVESGWAPGDTSRGTPDPRLAKIRALCSF